VNVPPVRLVRRNDTSRLVPFRRDETVLAKLATDDAHLKDLFELDDATNDRLLAENGRAPGIAAHDLVFGVPYFRIVNAPFCHAHPLGGRFNGPERGAWYAAFELATAQAEVAFHKWVELVETDWKEETATYVQYLADFSAEFHDLRKASGFEDCLAPDSYVASQKLAEKLLEKGSLGVVYPSVRRTGGTCLACFRAVLVNNVRQGGTFRFTFSGSPKPRIERVAAAARSRK
jgi:RES domain-containing protein